MVKGSKQYIHMMLENEDVRHVFGDHISNLHDRHICEDCSTIMRLEREHARRCEVCRR